MIVTFDIYNATGNPNLAEKTYEWVTQTFKSDWEYTSNNGREIVVYGLSLVKAEVFDRDQESYIATFQRYYMEDDPTSSKAYSNRMVWTDETYTFLGIFGFDREFMALANLEV